MNELKDIILSKLGQLKREAKIANVSLIELQKINIAIYQLEHLVA